MAQANEVTYERGKAIVFEVRFKKKETPFGDYALFDPSGTPKVYISQDRESWGSGYNLDKFEVGKYYYIWQTTDSTAVGAWHAKAECTDGTYDDVEISPNCLFLK